MNALARVARDKPSYPHPTLALALTLAFALMDVLTLTKYLVKQGSPDVSC